MKPDEKKIKEEEMNRENGWKERYLIREFEYQKEKKSKKRKKITRLKNKWKD